MGRIPYLLESQSSDSARSFTEQKHPPMGHCSSVSLKVKLSQRSGSLNNNYRPMGREAWDSEKAEWVETLLAKQDGLSSSS